jgi:ribosomal protein S18 acetylase RimI-like enzyme
MSVNRTASLIPGYTIRQGSAKDQALLLQFMQQAYQEFSPDQSIDHLAQTIEQHLSAQPPLWWVEASAVTSSPDPKPVVACLWLGVAVDQLRGGKRHTYIFLLYVAPVHRRRGVGSALMAQAENWARSRGEHQIGLQVFLFNQPALDFYRSLGYQSQAVWMIKPLSAIDSYSNSQSD